MSTHNQQPYRVEPFTALAEVYQAAGLAANSIHLVPQLHDLAFDLQWEGGTLLELACGTGDVAMWYSTRGLRVTALDASAQMLSIAQTQATPGGIAVEFAHADLRTYRAVSPFDLVVCFGATLNYLPSLRELELAFRNAFQLVAPGKLFMFDMHTIQGLASTPAYQVVSDVEDSHLIVTRSTFSYETLTLNTQYTIMRRTGADWRRADEFHVLRGHPLQAISRLLTGVGFRILRMLTSTFESIDQARNADRVVIVVQRDA